MKFNLDGNEILSENQVKFLDATISSQLKFRNHLSEIWGKKQKASMQLNDFKRKEKYLSKLGRLTRTTRMISHACVISDDLFYLFSFA